MIDSFRHKDYDSFRERQRAGSTPSTFADRQIWHMHAAQGIAALDISTFRCIRSRRAAGFWSITCGELADHLPVEVHASTSIWYLS